MASNPPAIVFSDWDGTITSLDSNDYLTDNLGFGYDKRKELNRDIIAGKTNFRDAFQLMVDSIDTPLPECIQTLKENIKLDPGFKDFYFWCKSNNIPVIVVSSGMMPIIKALLLSYLGELEASQITVIANDVRYNDDGSWTIVFRNPESGFGHDKSKTIKNYTERWADEKGRPKFFYCGDGVSDLSAARETDLLFAKKGMDLITYCENEGIPYTTFEDFAEIHGHVKEIIEGRKSLLEMMDNKASASRDAA